MDRRRLQFAGRLLLAGTCLAVAACGKIAAGGSGFGETCVRNSDCAPPFYCKDGKCALDAATVCEAGKKRCSGDAVETCSALGDRWEIAKPEDNCTTGCENAACRPAQCTPNERKCDAGMIFQCLSNGSAWAFVDSCPTTCDSANPGECAAPVCTAFDTRCKDGETSTLETCDSRGTSWVDSSCGDPASTLCVDGRCLPKACSVSVDGSGAVTSRDERCNGTIAEECNDTQTGWETMQVCANGCDYDQTTATASCPAAACVPFETKCDADAITLETCNSRGTAFVAAQCDASTEVCNNGACVAKACSDTYDATTGAVKTRETRCLGDQLQQCNDTETAFSTSQICQYGCTVSGGTASCAPQVCNDGDLVCDGLALEQCTPDHGSFGFKQYCPSGCTGTALSAYTLSSSPSAASCAPPFCSPLSRQCATDTSSGESYVNVCKADGTAYDRVENCPAACAAGECVVTADTCNPGDIRCTGYEVEECVRLSTGATEWRFSERCLGQCLNGSCVGTEGSAGCLGGASSTSVCGSSAEPVIPLHAMLADPANDKVPCDGYSQVLVYSDPIVSAAGTKVPDGTMITFTHDFPTGSPDSLLASADADPDLAGLQRPTLHGVAAAMVLAPATCDASAGRDLTVTASAGGRAVGSTVIHFAQPTDTSKKYLYVAEDFSTPAHEDRADSTTQWNTAIGAAVSLPPYSLGTGTDGDLCLGTGTAASCTDTSQTLDLAAAGYARSWDVSSLGAWSATVVSGIQPNLSPGDEVLLYSMWANGGAGTVGNYEFLKVASTASGTIVFTTPVKNSYGWSGVFNSTQRTIIQRVPNFGNITIPPNAVLTSAAPTAQAGFPANGTGVLALRATGTVRVNGRIDMQGKGLPAGLSGYPSATTTPGLSRLLEGRANTSGNGGIVVLTAGKLTFHDGTGADAGAGAVIRADGTGGGQGGTVWAAGGNFVLTTSQTRFFVGTGQIRLDYGQVDNTTGTPAVSDTAAYVGEGGPFTTETAVYNETQAGTGYSGIFQANLLGVLGGEGATTAVVPIPDGGIQAALPSFAIQTSADGGATWANAAGSTYSFSGAQAPFAGFKFRWMFTSVTFDDKPVYMRGVALKMTLK